MANLPAYADPNHRGNSADHHTGKPCVERGCDKPAGTAWSPLWCFDHNVERLQRCDRFFQSLKSEMTTQEGE